MPGCWSPDQAAGTSPGRRPARQGRPAASPAGHDSQIPQGHRRGQRARHGQKAAPRRAMDGHRNRPIQDGCSEGDWQGNEQIAGSPAYPGSPTPRGISGSSITIEATAAGPLGRPRWPFPPPGRFKQRKFFSPSRSSQRHGVYPGGHGPMTPPSCWRQRADSAAKSQGARTSCRIGGVPGLRCPPPPDRLGYGLRSPSHCVMGRQQNHARRAAMFVSHNQARWPSPPRAPAQDL